MDVHLIKTRAALGALLAALAVGAITPSGAAAPQVRPAPVIIPFELATRHIIVKVSINKSRPLSFILDTGASAAIVRLDVAKELGLSLTGSVTVRGAGPGSQAGQLVSNATWSLVGLDRVSQPVRMALPLSALPPAMGRDIDGIIGGQFISPFVVELDYQQRTMTLHERETFTYRGTGETLPLELDPNGHPVITATVTPVGGAPLERRFLLDTGAGGALALYSPFVEEQKLLGPQLNTIPIIGAAGAGGRTSGRLGRVASLQIGSFRIQNPITMFSQDTAGAFANPALAGNIGAQIANRFRVFLDYGRKQLILEPSPIFDQPFDRAFSGFAVRAEGPDYRTFRVHEVLEDSPATAAGVKVDDVITAIDEMPASSLRLSAIHELFEKPVSYRLTIRRGKSSITVTLTPAKLI
jgi:predicted aspartyl protease